MNGLKSDNLAFAEDDLPSLFVAANEASTAGQQRYLRLIVADLSLLISGAALSTFAVSGASGRALMAITGAVLLGISLVLTGIMRITQYEKIWYGSRAIAESVKTLTWRYMTGAEPYTLNLPPQAVDDKFTSDLSTILSEHKGLSGALGGDVGVKPYITERMLETRSQDTECRKTIYLSERVNDQRKWYNRNARLNERLEQRWFFGVMASQALALLSAILLVRWPELPINLTGVFSALASAVLAWLQVKQHQTLAQSYGLAAHELGLISEKARYVKTDDELSAFISDAENAISREHTLWIARRTEI